jgi:hypothetical protein
LAHARRLRTQGVKPQTEYRCVFGGCLLVAGYATPTGMLMYSPGLRTAAGYVRTLHHGTSFPAAYGGQGLHLPERAWILHPKADPPRMLANADHPGQYPVRCEHMWRTLPHSELRADMAEALKTNKTVKRRVSAQESA